MRARTGASALCYGAPRTEFVRVELPHDGLAI